MRPSECVDLTEEEIRILQESAIGPYVGFKVVTEPTVRWVKIENIFGIRVEYIREGLDHNYTHVSHYYFFNDDRMALVTLSYRLKDARLWKTDFSNVIRTFKWKI